MFARKRCAISYVVSPGDELLVAFTGQRHCTIVVSVNSHLDRCVDVSLAFVISVEREWVDIFLSFPNQDSCVLLSYLALEVIGAQSVFFSEVREEDLPAILVAQARGNLQRAPSG